MSASIIQRKAAFDTSTGSGTVAVTLDSPISAGSVIVIAGAVVQSNGSASFAPGVNVIDDKTNGYSPTVFGSSGSGFFANTFQGAMVPQAGARTYTLNFTAQTGGSGYTYLAGLCIYELSGVSNLGTNESASDSLSSSHKISDYTATISGLSGGTYGNFLVAIGAFLFTSNLTDANQVAAGSGWSLDGRDAANLAFSPAAICFESRFVDSVTNPAATFSGSSNTTAIDGTIVVGAYLLTAAISGGGSGGSGGGGTSTIFLGSVTEVSIDTDDNGSLIGTVTVLDAAPSGVPNPYLGKVKVVTAPAGRSNPSLGQVVVVGSAPAIDSNPYLGRIATS
jgi:hypothetical protein